MGRIYYLFGKSATGKDTIYSRLLDKPELSLKRAVMYTTRPRRSGETEGREYHFITVDELSALRAAGKVIEERTYDTVHGPWTYLLADDGGIDIDGGDYLIVGVLKSFVDTRTYYGDDVVMPLYIEVEDGERLSRALSRERGQSAPKYAEMCRRFISDQEDFSEERLEAAGITKRFINDDLERCIDEIRNYILSGSDNGR